MTEKKASWMLACVMVARATNMVFVKSALKELGTFNLLFVRFLIAFVLLTLLFAKRLAHIRKSTALHGIVLGSIFFVMMTCEVTAAHTTVSSVLSALINTAVIIVPLMNAILLRRMPKRQNIICAMIAFCGVIVLNWNETGFAIHKGEIICITEAFIYAGVIILTDRFSRREQDTVALGIVEVGTIGFLSLVASFLFEQPHFPSTMRIWWMILALAIICTGFGFTLQPVIQRHLPVETAGLMCAISPVVVTTLGIIFLNEKITIFRVIGITLIVLSLIIPHIPIKKSISPDVNSDMLRHA